MDKAYLTRMAAYVRADAVDMVYRSGDGHLGPSMSAADMVTYLFFHAMRLRPQEPHWPQRDRFILSKGHACPALYAALGLRGYFSRTVYPTLRSMDSILQGHPDMHKTPGVDMTSGSLGNGLGAGVGMALAVRLQESGARTHVLCGDGELGEGVIWEAAQTAAKYRLDTLTLWIDHNGMQSGGTVEAVGGVTRIADKFAAFGWQVCAIDGHDFDAIHRAATQDCAGPRCIVAHTVKGKGIPYMEHDNSWHKRTPDAQQYAIAMEVLGGVRDE